MIATDSSCPVCANNLDSATNADGSDHPPEEGDFSVCAYCASPLRFHRKSPKDGLRLRLVSDADMSDLDRETKIALAQAITYLKANPPPK